MLELQLETWLNIVLKPTTLRTCGEKSLIDVWRKSITFNKQMQIDANMLKIYLNNQNAKGDGKQW